MLFGKFEIDNIYDDQRNILFNIIENNGHEHILKIYLKILVLVL